MAANFIGNERMERTKIAIITGVTGQDGSYLAEFLLKKNYLVIGIARRSSVNTHERIKQLLKNDMFKVIEGDITDPHNVNTILRKYQPDEFYNLAAQSHVGTSFEQPLLTWKVDAEAVLLILEGIKSYSNHTRFYQASTSEMFGKNYSIEVEYDQYQTIEHFDLSKTHYKDVWAYNFCGSTQEEKRKFLEEDLKRNPCSNMYPQPFQFENTPFAPQSPYAIAKVAAHNAVQLYRSYGIHASAGILFNHESERRGENFVTRKITKWIGEFKNWHINEFVWDGLRQHTQFPKLKLGNLDACRDWGHAEDYVRAMWLMLQQEKPDDYIIATGETYSVRQFLDTAFKVIGINDWEPYVILDSSLIRPAEVDYLRGCPDKAKAKLGWSPTISFEQLVDRMVKYDISQAAATKIRS